MYTSYIIFILIKLLLFILNINILNIMYLFIKCLFKLISYIYIDKVIILINLINI